MGIVADSNHPELTHKTENALIRIVVLLLWIIEFVPQEQVKNEKILLSCRDQTICRKLITKYGDDYDVRVHGQYEN